MHTNLSVDAFEAALVARFGLGSHAWGGHAVWALTLGTLFTLVVNLVGCAS